MLPPLPRCSGWAYSSLISPGRISLPRKGCRVGLHIVLFEACSAFTRVAACTPARSPIRDTLIEGFSHFVTSMTAPIASGWSGCRVGFTPTGKRRLVTEHTQAGRWACRDRWLLALSSGADWGHQSKCCVRHLPCQPTGSTFAKQYCGAITTNAWSAELLAGLLKRTCITFSRVQAEDRTSRRTWSLCATAATLPIIQSSQDD